MTKLSKVLSLILAIIMVFNIGVLATETVDEAETTPSEETSTTLPEESTDEPTTDVVEDTTADTTEESTTEVTTEETPDVTETTTEATTEETTDVTETTTEATTEDTTTEVAEESTTAAEETTTEVAQETTTEVAEETTNPEEETTATPEEETTVPEEETTTTPEEETTTPEEIPTTTPDVTDPTDPTEPDVTEPDVTDPTDPEEPQVELPAAPANVSAGAFADGKVVFQWDAVEGATGYDVYLKSGDDWVLNGSVTKNKCSLKNIVYNSKYVIGIKTYVMVEDVKYESAEMTEYTVETGTAIPEAKLTATASGDTITLKWDAIKGVSGYRVYIKKDGKWVKLTSITGNSYTYKKALPGKTYKFAIKPYAKGTEGTKFGALKTVKVAVENYSKTTVKVTDKTSSSITIKWDKVKNASNYRVYIYKNGKWTYYKGITKNTYTIKGLKELTNYKIKVKPSFKVDGTVHWGSYSNQLSVTTEGKSVKAKYISNLKKNFTDGDWCVTVGGFKDDIGFEYTLTIAVKGDDIYVNHDYKESMLSDFAYLIQTKKEKVYFIRHKAKTYERLPADEALEVAAVYGTIAMIFDMETAKGVKAQNALYGGKAAITETYKDSVLGITKSYYFVGDSLKALKVLYADGSTETFKSIKIADTPSASYFKLPSGYKDFTA